MGRPGEKRGPEKRSERSKQAEERLETEGEQSSGRQNSSAAGCFQTDHVFGCVTDDVENFFLMPKTLNTKFSFHSEQQFKEEYTGGAWESVVVFVKHALIMYRSSGRL